MSNEQNNLDLEDDDLLDHSEDGENEIDDEEEDDEGSESDSPDSTLEASDDTEESEESSEDDEREAIRARRRQERAEKKQRIKERENILRSELAARDSAIDQLRQQIAALSGKNINSEVAQLDGAIKQAAEAYEYFKGQIAEGTKVGDGQVVADATEKMIQARYAAEHYNNIKKQYIANQNRPPPTDPVVQTLAGEWVKKNPWYDPAGGNVESRIARVIDDNLVKEGYNPATPSYWEELTQRCQKVVYNGNKGVYNKNMGGNGPSSPNGSNGQDKSPKRPKSTVVGSGSDSATAAKSGTYTLSADRKKALQDAGLWDDPKLRADAIRRYKEYDKANRKEN